MLNKLRKITDEIHKSRYPQAKVIFLAGSVIRGEGTATSDLDLVVVFDRLRCAYRDSYIYKNWPIEAFVHDPQTLEYFFWEVDRPTGFPSLATMVAEGIEVPGGDKLSGALKQIAESVLNEGPPDWNEKDLRNSRYGITDLIDDLREPHSTQEMYATATLLYTELANHYFRSRNIWSAKGKTIPRRLQAIDSCLASKFLDSFENLFSKNRTKEVIELTEAILAPDGGFLLEGYRLDAPPTWRAR